MTGSEIEIAGAETAVAGERGIHDNEALAVARGGGLNVVGQA